MPEIFIDNKRFEYEEPGKVLQFILDHGMDMPFFCYHPSLSIPANCRQCFVEAGQYVKDQETGEYKVDDNGEKEIRWFPKLMTSCSLDLMDGLVILTHKTSEKVRQGQADTLELILINHPLDCPICDQAGECPLQIQTYKYGPEGSRFEHKKVHKPKRIQLGPRVILDAERCINCTRCVRFTDEISKSHQLSIVSRGDKNYPITADGHEFDDPYSLNTVDICPVGALTSADFRFKARVWEMNQTRGIDVTNGKGVNIDLWTRDNLVLRITPRYNKEVNDHWMPDIGREGYKQINENRVSKPEMKLDGDQIKTSWNNTFMTISETLESVKPEEVLLIGSPHASTEDNFAFSSYFNRLGTSDVYFAPDVIKGAGDDLLLSDDQAPNANGCRALGFTEVDGKKLSGLISDSKYKAVFILSDDIVGRLDLSPEAFSGKFVVSFATNNNETTKLSDLVVPITCSAEHFGSYVNVDGRIQRTIPAKETMYSDRKLDLEMSMGRLDHFGTKFDNWVNDKNRVDCIPAWEALVRLGNVMNLDFSYTSAQDVFAAINKNIPALKDVSYDRMDEQNGIQLELGKSKSVNA